MIKRRGFLGMLGAAPIAASAAAKSVTADPFANVSEQVMRQHAVRAASGIVGMANPTPTMNGIERVLARRAIRDTVGVPSFVKEVIKRRYVDSLGGDPDIECLKSFSASAKRHLFRERRAKREYEGLFEINPLEYLFDKDGEMWR